MDDAVIPAAEMEPLDHAVDLWVRYQAVVTRRPGECVQAEASEYFPPAEYPEIVQELEDFFGVW